MIIDWRGCLLVHVHTFAVLRCVTCDPHCRLVAECLAQSCCPECVTVRPGIVGWDSRTGQHNRSDALSRLAASFLRHREAWSPSGGDDMMDAMNVDALCEAAYELFLRGERGAVYNMRGEVSLPALLAAMQSAARGL